MNKSVKFWRFIEWLFEASVSCFGAALILGIFTFSSYWAFKVHWIVGLIVSAFVILLLVYVIGGLVSNGREDTTAP